MKAFIGLLTWILSLDEVVGRLLVVTKVQSYPFKTLVTASLIEEASWSEWLDDFLLSVDLGTEEIVNEITFDPFAGEDNEEAVDEEEDEDEEDEDPFVDGEAEVDDELGVSVTNWDSLHFETFTDSSVDISSLILLEDNLICIIIH